MSLSTSFRSILTGLIAALAVSCSDVSNSVLLRSAAVDQLQGYDTIEEAGVYAIDRAYRCSHVYECGGLIAKRADGQFVVLEVVTSYRGDGVELPDDAEVPSGLRVVADYHTHPCLPESHYPRYFSPQDVGENQAQNHIGFMGDLCTGIVREFIPGKTPTLTIVEGEFMPPGHPASAGQFVGFISVEHVTYEPNTGTI